MDGDENFFCINHKVNFPNEAQGKRKLTVHPREGLCTRCLELFHKYSKKKESEYVTVSQKNSITDLEFITILDYLERHAKHFGLVDSNTICIDDKFFLSFEDTMVTIKGMGDIPRMRLPKKMLAENIVGIYGSLKYIS